MAAHDRSFTPARAARLILLVGALVALVWVLFGMLDRRLGGGGEGPRAAAPSSARVARRIAARDEVLEARLRSEVGKALAEAGRATKGKVGATNTTVAVSVRELGAEGEVVAIASGKSVRPASNQKLLTSAAVLEAFGPDGTLATVFEARALPQQGVVRGDLVVRAGGDPLYDRERLGDCGPIFAKLSADLKQRGVQRIAGDIVLDEDGWAEPGPGPGWPDKSQYWQETCALAGGFSVNAGCVTALVRSGPQGGKAQVEIHPRGTGLPEKIDVRTGPSTAKLDVRVGVEGGRIVVQGTIPAGVPQWSARFALPDPVQAFGEVLRRELERNDIVVDGEVRRQRRAIGGVELARIETRVADLLVAVNTDSNNAVADQLFYALGRKVAGEGTRRGGSLAVQQSLRHFDVLEEGWRQVDGSGLSRDNAVAARAISGLVEASLSADPRASAAFSQSLAEPGEGTLERRMGSLEGKLRAKTGFINGTSALSGTVEAADGRVLVFSILVQYPPQGGLNTEVWKPMQDAICKELARART